MCVDAELEAAAGRGGEHSATDRAAGLAPCSQSGVQEAWFRPRRPQRTATGTAIGVDVSGRDVESRVVRNARHNHKARAQIKNAGARARFITARLCVENLLMVA